MNPFFMGKCKERNIVREEMLSFIAVSPSQILVCVFVCLWVCVLMLSNHTELPL